MKFQFIICISICLLSIKGSCQVNFENGLIGYWPFSGNMLDSSVIENDGLNHECILVNDRNGDLNEAYEFNGLNSYIEIPYSYKELSIPFSISTWLHKSKFEVHEHIFSTSSQQDNYFGVYLSVSPEGRVQISYTNGGTVGPQSRRTKRTTSAIPHNEWTHIVVVVNGPNDIIIQFNSTIQEGEYSGSADNLVNGNSYAMIGHAAHNLHYWDGKIDDLRLYNRSLSSDELALICDSTLEPNIPQTGEKEPILIYPNPTNDLIKFRISFEVIKYIIFDISGKIVQSGKYDENSTHINVDQLTSGTYILSLIGSEEACQQLFIVTN